MQASGPVGLAVASDIGIVIQTLTLAVLLHRRRMVSIAGVDYPELLRALVASVGQLCQAWRCCIAPGIPMAACGSCSCCSPPALLWLVLLCAAVLLGNRIIAAPPADRSLPEKTRQPEPANRAAIKT